MRPLLPLFALAIAAAPLAAETCISGVAPSAYSSILIPFTVDVDCCDWYISTCESGSVNTAIGSVEGPGVSFEGDDDPGVCVNSCTDWFQPDYVDKDHGYNWITPGNPPECLPAGEYTLQLAIYRAWDSSCVQRPINEPIPYTVCFEFCTRSAADTEELPSTLQLGEAYPNPFNPSTTLEWSLARTADARLAVYDLAGREVAVLAQGLQAAGAHTSRFDATGLASGVYIATLEAEGRSLATKLVLLK